MPASIPSYYPAGWDRERILNATVNEINDLTKEQREVFREGLRADLGQQGFDEFFDEMFRREQEESGLLGNSIKTIKEPPFMEVLRICEDRGIRWDQWGFVVFKSPEIVDAEQWMACKKRFSEIINDSIDPYRGYAGLDDCVRKMKFQWVEDVKDAGGGIGSISRAYSSTSLLPGLNHSLCLYITPSSMDSILNSPSPSSCKRKYRTRIPFVVAVSKDVSRQDYSTTYGDIERASWRGFFNVAVETLLESLFPIVADDSMSPFEIGGCVAGDDVWCDYTRWGVHKAGIGYWDSRTGQAGSGL
ncbi:hypothetical protein F4813DRAFT_391479 [Daldinia decipiens]|uniref:uncharacterized protein n=1 Tax=Daldinia decipiens TaxID=326647 RepID=UPI0020C2398C|nr:uncharacterized protein F4813DRAFT_391479 [Daldinia decipiens]KAI1655630.1 hypothetical protein F4813DRAFT_391479 [Daldinia decipiens]